MGVLVVCCAAHVGRALWNPVVTEQRNQRMTKEGQICGPKKESARGAARLGVRCPRRNWHYPAFSAGNTSPAGWPVHSFFGIRVGPSVIGKDPETLPGNIKKSSRVGWVSPQHGDRPPASLTTRNENRFLGARLSRRLRLCSSNRRRRRPLEKEQEAKRQKRE